MRKFNHYRYSLNILLVVLFFTLASTAFAAPSKTNTSASDSSTKDTVIRPVHHHTAKGSKAKAPAAATGQNDSSDVIVNQEVDDPCYTLNTNEEWPKLFSEFSKAYSANDFEGALAITEELKKICAASPVLNYSIATTHREMGDNREALRYYKQAIENTKRFGVSEELMTKFWYARYELENADVICKQVDLDACENKLTTSESEAAKVREEVSRLKEAQHKRDEIVMWTGAGVGIAGVILAIAGGSMFGIAKENAIENLIPNDKTYTVIMNDLYRPGIALLGAGIGVAVAGAIMTGIGGYNYTHPLSDDVTASWNFTPQNLEFGLQF